MPASRSATTSPGCACGSPTTAPSRPPPRRPALPAGARPGHGIDGMRERAALHRGALQAGPAPGGGWLVTRPCCRAARAGRGGARMSISVLLADDQPLLRRGFRMILEAEPDLTVIAEAGDGAEAVEQDPPPRARRGADGHPDARHRRHRGHPAHYRGRRPDVRVLVLTTFDLDEYAFGALRAGASGFLLKDVRPAELVAAIRTVAAGDAVVSPRVTRRLLEEYAQVLPVPDQRDQAYPQLAALTEREREVLVFGRPGPVERGDRRHLVRVRGDGEVARRPDPGQAWPARPGPGGGAGLRVRAGPAGRAAASGTGARGRPRLGGGDGNRTRVQGFAGPCLSHSATPPQDASTRHTARAYGSL